MTPDVMWMLCLKGFQVRERGGPPRGDRGGRRPAYSGSFDPRFPATFQPLSREEFGVTGLSVSGLTVLDVAELVVVKPSRPGSAREHSIEIFRFHTFPGSRVHKVDETLHMQFA